MSHRKISVLIVEDDSQVSRVVRNHIIEKFPGIRVDIAGSAAKAQAICEKFTPTFIIWDGAPNERGTLEEYLNCIPETHWPRVIPISTDEEILNIAKQRNAHPPLSKKEDAINTWSKEIVAYIETSLKQMKKKK